MTAFDLVLAALDAHGCRPQQSARRATAKCPSHDDHHPSLSIAVGDDGRVLLCCHAGCPPADVMAAVGLRLRDLFEGAENQVHQDAHSGAVRKRTRFNGSNGPIRAQAGPADPTTRQSSPSHHVIGAAQSAKQGNQRLIPIFDSYRQAITARCRAWLASDLGVSEFSLEALDVGWDAGMRCWAFPMRDGDGLLVGVRLRRPDGRKLTLKGTHQGLFLPDTLRPAERLFIAEGPTDTAALLDMGLNAAGRPSCTGGRELVLHLVRRLRPIEVIVVADADAPGQRGANDLAARLIRYTAVRVITPPTADMRAWLVQGGATPGSIEALVKAAPANRIRASVTTFTGRRPG